ncbi:MAG: hypothetical protein IJ661_13195, partial [Lachnospiraceae bacterium]|nr:hypothetical protein [Lachnospiraceae bacterium]
DARHGCLAGAPEPWMATKHLAAYVIIALTGYLETLITVQKVIQNAPFCQLTCVRHTKTKVN